MANINIEEIKDLIPQRFPFLMLDRVVELKEGEFIRAYKNVSINEEYFKGHFPENPIFPGALITEAMAQAACVLFKKSISVPAGSNFYLTNIKVRFSKIVMPGDQLFITAKSVKMVHSGGVFEIEATVNGDVAAKGEMSFACK